ncbi:RNA-binding protein [Mesorhizobium sp. WSM4884]|uniref:RNA-binding protein n=1 Tax=Mesorhizobium sp. WSM4884 TaxID=3038542 RepID=UPI002417364F|nr:RNA-binding protein [Mesorhizobium sp. WSM4884]MDG4881860.1 RNA-binding protein [Mesorhizobium sp. WSM4884]
MQRYREVYEPADLDLLQRVFDRLCREHGLTPHNSDQREALALKVISAFEKGVTDEAELLQALSP